MKTKKLSSYQKMKQEYEARITELESDIFHLVTCKDLEKHLTIKMRWMLKYDLEEAVMDFVYSEP